jgi:hypothetical protein
MHRRGVSDRLGKLRHDLLLQEIAAPRERLDEAIDHYAAAGRTMAESAYAGVGRQNSNKSRSIRSFTLRPGQRADLLAFLHY